ncbi:hypothetical protein B0H19DRAFT_1259774 [Mycena capillaripes]|nr:hypothetical protein B0H19DRAFT_1259774 [Mycena capillaripes]
MANIVKRAGSVMVSRNDTHLYYSNFVRDTPPSHAISTASLKPPPPLAHVMHDETVDHYFRFCPAHDNARRLLHATTPFARFTKHLLSEPKVLPDLFRNISHIFDYCGGDGDECVVAKPSALPIVLAFFCAQWRAIVLSTSDLWSRADFASCTHGGLELLKFWLSHTGTRVISVHFSFDPQKRRRCAWKFIAALAEHSAQWQDISFVFLHKDDLNIDQPFPLLRRLTLEFPHNGSDYPEEWAQIAVADLQDAPLLREGLCPNLVTCKLIWDTRTLGYSVDRITYVGLREIDLYGCNIPITLYVDFPALRRVRLHQDDYTKADDVEAYELFRDAAPNLSHLWLSTEGGFRAKDLCKLLGVTLDRVTELTLEYAVGGGAQLQIYGVLAMLRESATVEAQFNTCRAQDMDIRVVAEE